MELWTAPFGWLHPNAAAIGLDDSSTNRKTKPQAFRFRAHERLEELGCDVRRYARPGVSHRHANKSRLIGRRPDREKTAGRRAHRIHRVADEVDQDLLDLDLFDTHAGCLMINIDPGSERLLAGAEQPESRGLVDTDRQAPDRLPHPDARHEIRQ